MPIPEHNALDDETLARPVTIADALAAMDVHTGQTVQGPPSGDTGEAISVARESRSTRRSSRDRNTVSTAM